MPRVAVIKMRLLHSSLWQMTEFIVDDEIPPYAILSHTWGENEVTFQKWQTLSHTDVQRMTGWKKIEYCRKQAVADGYEWVWADT